MAEGGIITAFFAWLKVASPYLYDGLLVLLGKEWQRKIDEAATERAIRLALEKQMEDVRRANEAARTVDDSDDDGLDRLRDFWK